MNSEKNDPIQSQIPAVAVGDEADTRRHAIHVIVFAPRSPHPKTFTWLKTLRVGDAARQAATAFGYSAAGNPGFQTEGRQPRVLDNNKTLGEEHVDDGDKLELIDTGGGVWN